VYKFRAAT